jgi:two-component system sensor histidine kinase MtrB
MGGLRARLSLTLVALVALTAAVLGIGAYAFVDASLHDRLWNDARNQAVFNLSVLWPASELGPGTDLAAFEASPLPAQLPLRTRDGGTLIEFPTGETWSDPAPLAALEVPAELRRIVDAGQLGWAWSRDPDGASILLFGGRPAGGGPLFVFVSDATSIDDALGQFRLGLGGGALVLIVVAVLAAGFIARGILRPVDAAARAADRIEAGDLSTRIGLGRKDELGRLTSSIDAMAATLEGTVANLEASQMQNKRFVADVSHELRTPLTALVAEASLLEAQLPELPPDARRPAELLVTDVGRLRVLVEDLMELSRFDAHAEQILLTEVDLVRLVRATIAARLPGATLETDDPELTVRTDPRRLDRILGNLLDNAREHAPGAPVEVSLGRDGRHGVLLEVADRGPGVPADRLPELFERFEKADPSRPGGSGLGLAIAAEHAALLGGSLTARQRPGGGLVFTLRLPVTERLPPGALPDTEAADHAKQMEPAS